MVGDLGRSNATARRLARGELAQAVWTPEGPACVHLHVRAGVVEARAWGEGREALLDRVPAYLGLDDPPARLGGRLAALEAKHPGLRSSRALNLVDLVIGYVIRQRVAWRDALRSQLAILRAHGRAAPGPFAITLPLAPAQWATLGAADLAAFGLERKRAGTLLEVAARAERIEQWGRELEGEAFAHRLELLAGIGPWTSGMVRGVGLGDPDVVPTGDYDLPSLVAFALAGEPRADDARMLALLEPWRGARFRVIKLLWASGITTPRFGPRIRGTEPGRRGF